MIYSFFLKKSWKRANELIHKNKKKKLNLKESRKTPRNNQRIRIGIKSKMKSTLR